MEHVPCHPAARTLVALAVHLGGDELYMSGHVVARAADVVAGRRPHTGSRFASHGNAGGARATDVGQPRDLVVVALELFIHGGGHVSGVPSVGEGGTAEAAATCSRGS